MKLISPLAITVLFAVGCSTASQTGTSTTPTPESGATRAASAATSPTKSIADAARGMEKLDGFIPVYLDPKGEKIFLEIPRDSMRVLYLLSLATGLGSNPIGLDRGSGQAQQIARFDHVGDRMLLVFENWNYRSSDKDDPDHVRTVDEAFPSSIVAALPVMGESDGRFLVDATDFVLSDRMNAALTLARSDQGSYSVARDRSSIYRPYTKAFPENTEIDASLTYALSGNRPGRIVNMIAPDGRAFTLRQHMSFVQLPDSSYEPRADDPRVGYFGITFNDYAQPIQGQLQQTWIERHRLQRVDRSDPNSPIRNPIVYYIDRGIPEPIRSAVKEGVSWWAEAFDKAGLTGGFVVKDLPEGADPMDARYNVVQWENRNERGWSIGGALADPRTGEIMKGMARLDSHRERTDYNLYAGLMGAASSAADTAFVLARSRQKAAHEVGHTLGLAHNYIASTYDRGSVMDYPPPRVRLDSNGNIDVSDAYDVGPGAYDVWAIRWGYGIFPGGTEGDSLRAIVADGLKNGFLYLSDADARPEYASDPRVNLWDDDATPAEFLKHEMDVRRVAMSRFGLRNIRAGEPITLLQDRFVPVYLMHRFAMSSLARAIGGMEYSNALSGDGQQATRPVAAERQRAALSQLLGTLDPKELAIPDTVVTLLGPAKRPFGELHDTFDSRTFPMFDELGAARALAQLVIDDILQRERAGRLVAFAARSSNALSLDETIDSLVAFTWNRPVPADRHLAALQRVTSRALADRLLMLAADTAAAPEVRAIAELEIADLRPVAESRAKRPGTAAARAHWAAIAGDFTRWIERRELPKPTPALEAPPIAPFGQP